MQSRTRSRLLIWLGVIVLVLLVAGAAVVYVVGMAVGTLGKALVPETHVAVTPKTSNGQLELELSYGKNVTGLDKVTVLDVEGNKLWEISAPGTGKPGKVVYGQVPTEPDVAWQQNFPEGGKPPADIRGKTVQVKIDQRFLVAIGVGHELTEVTVEMPK
ncbi:MAG TPA: hypothetical protein VKE40_15930 [Gemmataceae bacterium]|nr:hypothetical protein [Gemmataceae bacterium]